MLQITGSGYTTTCSEDKLMDDKQKVLTELLKLKEYLIRKLNGGTFRIEVQNILDKVNESIDNVEKNER